jgi:hypothetical protein
MSAGISSDRLDFSWGLGSTIESPNPRPSFFIQTSISFRAVLIIIMLRQRIEAMNIPEWIHASNRH